MEPCESLAKVCELCTDEITQDMCIRRVEDSEDVCQESIEQFSQICKGPVEETVEPEGSE